MAKRKITYEDLVSKLQAIGVQINVGNLRVRVSKGAFSAALLIQCLRLWGLKICLLRTAILKITNRKNNF